jgi:hypothetical protein
MSCLSFFGRRETVIANRSCPAVECEVGRCRNAPLQRHSACRYSVLCTVLRSGPVISQSSPCHLHAAGLHHGVHRAVAPNCDSVRARAGRSWLNPSAVCRAVEAFLGPEKTMTKCWTVSREWIDALAAGGIPSDLRPALMRHSAAGARWQSSRNGDVAGGCPSIEVGGDMAALASHASWHAPSELLTGERRCM